MLTNLKTPGLIFRQPAGWDEDQKADVRAAVAGSLSVGRRGSPLFLEGADASIEMAAPLKDLDWPGLTSLSDAAAEALAKHNVDQLYLSDMIGDKVFRKRM